MLSKMDSEAKCEVCDPGISEPSETMACFVLNSAGECVQNSSIGAVEERVTLTLQLEEIV